MKRRQTLLGAITRLVRARRGATAVEYALIAALIALAALTAIAQVASQTTGLWSDVNGQVSSAVANP